MSREGRNNIVAYESLDELKYLKLIKLIGK